MNVVSASVGQLAPLNWLDTVVIVFYFVAVLSLGFLLKRQTNTSEDFFLAGREMSAWVAGVVLGCGGVGLSTILGALYRRAAQVIAVDINPTRLHPHTYQEFPGGHEWSYWQTHLAETLHFIASAKGNRGK